MSGEEANITKMPADGAQLKAVWQAMLVFDENGGTEVKDISQEAGTAITLPTPEKEGLSSRAGITPMKKNMNRIYACRKRCVESRVVHGKD